MRIAGFKVKAKNRNVLITEEGMREFMKASRKRQKQFWKTLLK